MVLNVDAWAANFCDDLHPELVLWLLFVLLNSRIALPWISNNINLGPKAKSGVWVGNVNVNYNSK